MSAATESAVPGAISPATPACPTTGRRILFACGWLLLPVACHIGFSWIGFNPTDDGWLQAVARRIADGQVPHRDFISVRPVLSAALQVPLVWFGGEHVIWWSRLWGWVTLGTVCWLWSGRVVDRASRMIRYLLYGVALLLGAHIFPVMAWHTLDGMLLATVAVVIAAHDTPRTRAVAFFLAGSAALCRQNFGLFPPLLLLSVGGPIRSWFIAGFWSALPIAIYALLMWSTGAARDFVQQLWAASGVFTAVAVRRFAHDVQFACAVPAGVAFAALLRSTWWQRSGAARGGPALVFGAIGLGLAGCMWRFPWYGYEASFGLFGFVLGMSVLAIVRGISAADRLTLGAGLGLTWVASISIGYNNPALMSGVLLLLLWRLFHCLAGEIAIAPAMSPALLLIVPAIALSFSHARQTYPYRDRPADVLRYDVGNVLAGGAGLRTNETTYATLGDLQQITREFQHEQRRYVVLTDCPAIWIRDPNSNPLGCDWPQETELGYNRDLFGRLFADLKQLPPTARIVVQRYLISDYSWRLAPVTEGDSYYYLQTWIRSHYTKIGQTQFFEIYLPPMAPTAAALHR